MNKPIICSIAYEMLQSTNPYCKPVDDFFYNHEGRQIKLVDLVNEQLKNSRAGYRNLSSKNLIEAYNAIAEAMVIYLEDFGSSYSFRQKTKRNFSEWLENIRTKYQLGNLDIPFDLMIKVGEEDTGITMVKALQTPHGITKDSLQDILKTRSDRSIQKNLRKLSPDLYEGDDIGNRYEPFQIGGQPLTVKINVKTDENYKRYYNTPNTLHPIILQENLLQVEILLKALSLSRYQYQSNISTYIALDIWNQLSDYAKEKIKKHFEYEDDIHQEFLQEIEYDVPDEHMYSYQPQREMIEQIDATPSDILRYMEKTPDRKCTLKYKNEDGERFYLKNVKIHRLNQLDYIATDIDGNKYLFREDWIGNIIIE